MEADRRVILSEFDEIWAFLKEVDFRGRKWSIWRGPSEGDGLAGEKDIDLRSSQLSHVNLANFVFENGHRYVVEGDGHKHCIEEHVSARKKIVRLKTEKPHLIRLGGNVLLSLWSDYKRKGVNSALEWLCHNFDVYFMDFTGLALRDPRGMRAVIHLWRVGPALWKVGYVLDHQWGVTCNYSACYKPDSLSTGLFLPCKMQELEM